LTKFRHAAENSALSRKNTEQQSETAARVLETASELFYRDGVRAVGVDLIVSRSGIAKTSLYRHFATKDDLVAAFLEREDAEFWSQWNAVVKPHANDALAALLLDWIGRRVSRDGYRGCPQINVAAEFSDSEHPARRVRRRHKAQMHDRLLALVSRLGVNPKERLAAQLALLIDGAFMSDGRLAKGMAPNIVKSAARP
jgi:AcrR family transcriptional regulator